MKEIRDKLKNKTAFSAQCNVTTCAEGGTAYVPDTSVTCPSLQICLQSTDLSAGEKAILKNVTYTCTQNNETNNTGNYAPGNKTTGQPEKTATPATNTNLDKIKGQIIALDPTTMIAIAILAFIIILYFIS